VKAERRTDHLNRDTKLADANDPVLSMLGVGQALWREESGDAFVDRLRSEDEPPKPSSLHPAPITADSVWKRVESHQGEEFKTATGLPLTYSVKGPGIWFYRNGRRINRKLTRAQFEIAVTRCPLSSTTEIKDLIDYPYLFALLTDYRIRGKSW